MLLKTYKQPKKKIGSKKTSIGGLALLKDLQMTKGKTHEEIKQALKAQCFWKTCKWLKDKHKKKENQHKI